MSAGYPLDELLKLARHGKAVHQHGIWWLYSDARSVPIAVGSKLTGYAVRNAEQRLIAHRERVGGAA